MTNRKIPIVIGVTGHRDLMPETTNKLEELVKIELMKLLSEFKDSDFIMLNSLASGADTLCAKVALNLGIKLVCPLPMEISEYQKDFNNDELLEFNNLVEKADEVFLTPHIEEYKEGKNYLYRQAGIYVAKHCHVLLALWDGSPYKENGCGTAEAVDFALNGIDKDISNFNINNDGAVIWIKTPRLKNKESINIEVKILENKKGSLKGILNKTNKFNKESISLKTYNKYSLLNGANIKNKKYINLENIYNIADSLSTNKQRTYNKILKVISFFSVILVLCYLLYDEAALNICLVGFGIFLILYAIFYTIINKKDQYNAYLEYRVLSESLRVQYYLSLLGIDESVYDYFTWTQKIELTWIKKALEALLIGKDTKENVTLDTIKENWIDGQLDYHIKALNNDNNKFSSMKTITHLMLKMTCTTYVVVLVLELFFSSSMNLSVGTLDVRTIFKILWGCVSAVTVFVSAYYGKMSLSRKVEDHIKMIELFKMVSSKYETDNQDNIELFKQLAKEEIIENGNWLSYCKENKPDFTL